MQLREERQPHETRLLSELRTVQSRHMRPTASHRLDGYTSDTTAFADDDDDYTIPLHINTMQKSTTVTPGSSSTYSTLKSNYSTVSRNERPFMTVKRAHERYAQVSCNTIDSVDIFCTVTYTTVDNKLLKLLFMKLKLDQVYLLF